MSEVKAIIIPVKRTLSQRIRRWLYRKLRLTNALTVKLYHGYGNPVHCQVFGHVLSLGPLPRKKYRNIFLFNTLAVLRLFMVRPVAHEKVYIEFEGITYTAETQADGFFRLEWEPVVPLEPGKYNIDATLFDKAGHKISVSRSNITIPHPTQFAFISDIDDTFLISHSGNLRRRLYVMLTQNARSRKPFEGVVNHYQLLSMAGAAKKTNNAFFYVSSSEWNLYDYIREFSHLNKLPDGVYLLSQLKRFSQVFKTGQNNHKTKFMRIVRIMEAFPQQVFVLLGDDSQEDPNIYASVVSHFPKQVYCVYIRMVSGKPKPEVMEKLNEIKSAGKEYCYFKHSSEAVIHSKKTGIIQHL